MKVGDVLARYKPAERSIRVLMDGSIQSEMDEATRRLRQARRDEAGLRSDVPAIEEELAKLEVRAEEASVTFKVSAIPGKDFDRLKYENPPTEKDWQRYRETQQANPSLALMGHIGAPEFNFETFMSKLIGLSITEVDGEEVDWSEDDGVELWESLHDGARSTLADAVWEVNGDKSSRPLSETVTDMTKSSANGSTTPPNTESPTPSTSDE
jgi:hypothetical protein